MTADGLPAQLACRVLGVSESGFHAWRGRAPSQRAVRHAWLTDLIVEVHAASEGVYGARRVHAELTLGHGVQVGHNAVEMLMRRAGLQGVTGRPRFRKIENVATASDRVERSFGRSEANELWVTDITEHRTREGKVYCAVVLDAWSRRVVGWSIDSTLATLSWVHWFNHDRLHGHCGHVPPAEFEAALRSQYEQSRRWGCLATVARRGHRNTGPQKGETAG